MASALETLCGQDYGAKQCSKLRNSDLHWHVLAYRDLSSNLCHMDLHGKTAHFLRPRPFNFT